ncbi:solute carrier family 25 member 45-like [Littorina saxatilis]|uniref:Uncharacterized protein n=1 Tax=Littorina saxatilis TaxID=31220 RepID=A0AAN9AL11_9CAEN
MKRSNNWPFSGFCQIRGFFRGLSYPLWTYAGVNAVIFGVYGTALRHLTHDRPPGMLDVYLAGCAAGAAQLVIACPVDVIKCTLQAQIPHQGATTARGRYYSGPGDCLRAVWRQKKLAGLYRGLTSMSLRDVPSYGLYLVCYEAISSALHRKGWTDSHGVIADVIGGGLAGTISWFIVMPIDVIKSRVQCDTEGRYRGFMHCASVAIRQEGVSVLYRGTLVTCLRGFPVNAVTFLIYTKTLKYLNRSDEAKSVYECFIIGRKKKCLQNGDQ